MKRRSLDLIRVFSSPLDRRRGRIRAGTVEIPCALGFGRTIRRKREGDGGTPIGRLRPLSALYRGDRIRRPATGIAIRRLRPDDGWCEDPGSRHYNRSVRLPHDSVHDRMWREDALYDVVVDLSHNRGPIVPGFGSAIFLHVARPGLTPTQGCVAVAPGQIHRLLGWIGPATVIEVVG